MKFNQEVTWYLDKDIGYLVICDILTFTETKSRTKASLKVCYAWNS